MTGNKITFFDSKRNEILHAKRGDAPLEYRRVICYRLKTVMHALPMPTIAHSDEARYIS